MNLYSTLGKWLYPSFIWKIDDAESVYITFDDGPHPKITPWVLDTLEEYEARATFFVVGENAGQFPEVIRMIKKRGHTIANHTYSHLNGWKNSNEKYLRNVDRCASVIGRKGMFRPPFGRIKRGSYKKMKDYKIVMWSVLAHDYKQKLDLDHAFYRLTRQTKKGSIVVFHDSEKANKNLKYLLPRYLEFLKEANVKMDALPE